MKGKFWRYMLVVFAAICMCIGFAACDFSLQLELPSNKPQLEAPQQVKIEENILSWAAVNGASEYTVKLNSDETTKVTTCSLDLTTVTEKLVAGENTIAVKANATDTMSESKYSESVKYTYTPAPAAHVHALTKHDAKAASCTEPGNALYYECTSGCGKFFSDDKGEKEMEEGSWVLQATGHTYGEPEWTWTGNDADGYTAAQATFKCTQGDDEKVENSKVEHAEQKVGCTLETAYTAKVTFGGKDYTGKKTVVIEGQHTFGEWQDEVAATCAATGTRGHYTCSVCHKHFAQDRITEIAEKDLTIPVDNTAHDLTEVPMKTPTCTEAGYPAHDKCTRCDYEEEYDEIPATGHDYGNEWAITNPTDAKPGKAVKTCQNCAEGTEGHTKEVELPVLGDEHYQKTGDTATCTAPGKVTYTIMLDGETFSFDVATSELGHAWSQEWTTENGRHWHECTRCDEKNAEGDCEYSGPVWTWTGDDEDGYTAATAKFTCTTCHAEQTVDAEKIDETVDPAATCEEDGTKTYTAEVEFGEETYTDSKKVTLPATGHAYGDPVWEWTGDDTNGYTAATATFTCQNDEEHVLTKEATVDSVETQDVCTKNTVYTATVKVDFGEQTYTATKTVRLEGQHNLEEVEAQDPTCTVPGNQRYYKCTNEGCGKFFSDDRGTEEMEKDSWVLQPTGHEYNSLEWAWAPSEDGYSATATFTCGKCQDKQIKTAEVSVETTGATCTADGKTTYTATVTFEEQSYTSTKEMIIRAKGHAYGDPEWEWTGSDEEGYTAATAKFTCKNDGEHVVTENATISVETKPASCTATGSTTYKATVHFGEKDYSAEKEVEIPMTEHKLQKHERKEPTFTESGYEAYWQCTECNKYFSDANGETPIDGPVVLEKLTGSENADEYIRLVEAIGSITNESDKAAAEAVQQAIEAAEAQYEKLSTEEKALENVTKAQESFTEKKNDFDTVYNTAKELADEYAKAVEAAKTENAKAPKKTADDDGKTLESLSEKLTEANTKWGTLSHLAQSLGADANAKYEAINKDYVTWKDEVEAEVNAYKAAVDAIPEITENSTQEQATAAQEKIEAAERLYEALSYEAKEQVKATHATYEDRETAYNNAMKTADEAYKGFTDKLAAAQAAAVVDEDATVSALKEAIEAATSAKTALSKLASGLVTKENESALTALGNTLETWQQKVTAEAAELTITTELDPENDETAEDIIKAVDALLAADEDLPAYVTTAAAYIAAKTAVEDKKSKAESQLKDTVDALKSAVDKALALEDGTAEKAKEKYEALLEVQEQAAALGTYAKKQYNDYHKVEIESAIDALTKVAASHEDYATYIAYTQSNYMLIRKFYNVLGEPIQLDTDPSVTATVGDQAATSVTVEYKENGTYIALIPISMVSGAETVTLTYKWNDSGDVDTTVKLGELKPNLYSTADDHRLYDTDGKIKKFGNNLDGKVYLYDIYWAKDLDITQNAETGKDVYGDVDLTISGLPLFHGVTDDENGIGSTLAELTRYLAQQGLRGEMDLRLVVYHKWEESGVTYYTKIDKYSVSEKLHFNLTDDDVYIRLDTSYLSGNIQAGGQFELYNPAFIGQINEQVNERTDVTDTTLSTVTTAEAGQTSAAELDMRKYFQARIRAINVDEEGAITVLHEEAVEMVFIGYKMQDFISAWTVAYFKEHLAEYKANPAKENPTYQKVQYQVRYEPKPMVEDKENPLLKAFRASDWKDVEQVNGEQRIKTFTVTLDKTIVTATNEVMAKFNSGKTAYEFFIPTAGTRGGVFTEHYADRVLLDISKTDSEGQTITLHMAFIYVKNVSEDDGQETYTLELWRVDEYGVAVIGDNAQYTAADKDILNVTNSWSNLKKNEEDDSDFIAWIKNAFADQLEIESFDPTDNGWHYKTKIIAGSDVEKANGWFFDGEWSAEFTYPTAG